MNRQQFNQYLGGQIYPSKHNLSQICQFFKLSEEELNLVPRAFTEVVSETYQADVDTGAYRRHLRQSATPVYAGLVVGESGTGPRSKHCDTDFPPLQTFGDAHALTCHYPR